MSRLRTILCSSLAASLVLAVLIWLFFFYRDGETIHRVKPFEAHTRPPTTTHPSTPRIVWPQSRYIQPTAPGLRGHWNRFPSRSNGRARHKDVAKINNRHTVAELPDDLEDLVTTTTTTTTTIAPTTTTMPTPRAVTVGLGNYDSYRRDPSFIEPNAGGRSVLGQDGIITDRNESRFEAPQAFNNQSGDGKIKEESLSSFDGRIVAFSNSSNEAQTTPVYYASTDEASNSIIVSSPAPIAQPIHRTSFRIMNSTMPEAVGTQCGGILSVDGCCKRCNKLGCGNCACEAAFCQCSDCEE